LPVPAKNPNQTGQAREVNRQDEAIDSGLIGEVNQTEKLAVRHGLDSVLAMREGRGLRRLRSRNEKSGLFFHNHAFVSGWVLRFLNFISLYNPYIYFHLFMAHSILASALRRLPSGVNVITAGRAPNRSGYTGTAFFSLSFEPQRVIISVNRNSSAFPVIRDAEAFAVNLLSTDQQDIAERFAGKHGAKGEERYAGAVWRTGELGVSLLDGAVTNIECRIEEIIERHSHALIIGEVFSVAVDQTREALVYHDSRYGAVTSPAAVSSSALAAE